jgi:hypothetical protein
MLKTLQGRASAWLLSRPSNQQVNRASLAAAFGLLLALVLLLGAAGILQWILANQIQTNQDARTKWVLLETTTSLQMTQQIGDAHRSTLAFLLARDSSETQDSLARRHNALESYRQNLAKIRPAPDTPLARQTQKTSELASKYDSASATLIEMVQAGQMDQALDYRLQTVRPLFESWQSAQENLAISLAEQANAKNARAETLIRNLRTALLALIALPVLLLALSSIAFAALLGWEKFTARSQTTPDPWSH